MDPSWYCHLLTAVASSEKFQTFGKREELKIWFEKRATDIEEMTSIAENALKLCDIGLDLGLRSEKFLLEKELNSMYEIIKIV